MLHTTVHCSHADVPEGKGVSSSAAVEVAAMSALAAAYGIQLEGRELALLCQRVENTVVGELATCLSVALRTALHRIWWVSLVHDLRSRRITIHDS